MPSDATELKTKILRELHESPLGGHLGARKLSRLVSDRFVWSGLEAEVRDFCK